MAKKQRELCHPDTEELKSELQTVNLQLRCAYERYDYVCEPELIDACIYEIKYLKARYDYLLRRIKECSGAARAAQPAACAATVMKGGPMCLS